MATPRGAEHRDLEQRFRDLEARVQRLTSLALRRDQLQVSSGDFVVSGGGGVVVEDGGGVTVQDGGDVTVTDGGSVVVQGGAFQLRDPDGTLVWDAAAGPMKAKQVFQEDSSVNFTDSFASYGGRTVNVPTGYSQATVIMMVAAGASFSSVGNVSVQPVVNGEQGPAINSGNSSVSVANSFYCTNFSIGAGQTTVELHLRAAKGGTTVGGSGNWHMAGLVLFLR